MFELGSQVDTNAADVVRQNKRHRVGRYRFYLVRSWNTRVLRDGVHTVEVVASDTAGNRTTTRFTVIVRN